MAAFAVVGPSPLRPAGVPSSASHPVRAAVHSARHSGWQGQCVAPQRGQRGQPCRFTASPTDTAALEALDEEAEDFYAILGVVSNYTMVQRGYLTAGAFDWQDTDTHRK